MVYYSSSSIINLLTHTRKLQLYDDQGYKGTVLEDRSGTLTQPCKTLSEGKVNKAESMHWDHCGAGCLVLCNVRLYDDNQCSGRKIGDAQYGNWNLPAFSDTNKNKVNSYKIDCNE